MKMVQAVDQTGGCKKCGLGTRANLQVIAEKVFLNQGEGKGENEGGGIQWEENEVINVLTFSCADKAFQESCKSQAPHLLNDTLPQHSALEHVAYPVKKTAGPDMIWEKLGVKDLGEVDTF